MVHPEQPICEPDAGEAEGGGIDYAHALELLGFFLRAPRRRPRLAAAVLVAGGLATAAVAMAIPRVYTVETKILTQRSVVMPLLSNPHRSVPTDWDAPARGASEAILRRDNLAAIIQETGLLDHWTDGRPTVQRLIDALRNELAGPASEEDRTRALVGTLEKKLTVVTDDTSIKIAVAWYEPDMAYRLAACAERNFLKDRSAGETAAITEAIAILEGEAARQREAMEAAAPVAEARAPTTMPPSSEEAQRPVASRAPSPAGSKIAAELAEITAELAEKHQAIQTIQNAHQRRVGELQAQLAELRLTYASAHPSVLALEEKIRRESPDPPELAELTRAEAELQARAQDSAPSRVAGRVKPPASPPASPPAGARPPEAEREAPEAAEARAKLSAAQQKHQELIERIDAARIELHTAQAAFKYRYVVVQAAERPRKPSKSSALVVLLGGLVLSVALALLAAGLRDLASDRFIEPWQVRRRLPLPLLAEVKTP